MPERAAVVIDAPRRHLSVAAACRSACLAALFFACNLQGRDDDLGGQGANSAASDLACKERRAVTRELPLHLILLLDRSSSMCRYDTDNSHRDCDHPSSRWSVLSAALRTFGNSDYADGVSLSLLPFPKPPQGAGDLRTQCLADYASEVSLDEVRLPSERLGQVLAQAKPDNQGWVTPTTPAVLGAVQYARSTVGALAEGHTVAMVFATDGQPKDCSAERDAAFRYPDGDVGEAAELIASAYTGLGVRTYVIGLDDPSEDLSSNLGVLAQSGRSGQPWLIPLDNPGVAGAQLSSALERIRGKASACELPLVRDDDGALVPASQVQVALTVGGGRTQHRAVYSADCSQRSGWRYDSPTEPSKMQLCLAVCALAEQDPSPQLEVLVGCSAP